MKIAFNYILNRSKKKCKNFVFVTVSNLNTRGYLDQLVFSSFLAYGKYILSIKKLLKLTVIIRLKNCKEYS